MKPLQYKEHRQKLLHACGDDALIIVSAPFEVQATHDSAYSFKQDAQFFWLTGIESPGWKLIIDGLHDEEYLVAPERDSSDVIFNGEEDWTDIQTLSGISKVLGQNDAHILLKRLASSDREVYTPGADSYTKYLSAIRNPSYAANRRWLKTYFEMLIDCRPALNKARALKTNDEMDRMRHAIAITCNAFAQAKRSMSGTVLENELEAEFDYLFRKNNVSHAYEPIVASGSNALVLHYIKNNAALPENGLVVIDIGAAYENYAADITRTYAIGSPSKREIEVHAAVVKAQADIIALIAPGVSLSEYNDASNTIMKTTLTNLGLLKSLDDEDTYRKYFPHAVSHGLGIDVHESLGGFKTFQPGMVLTVEPGIYIPEEGIGVRIEDDILVTAAGNENLSAQLPVSL